MTHKIICSMICEIWKASKLKTVVTAAKVDQQIRSTLPIKLEHLLSMGGFNGMGMNMPGVFVVFQMGLFAKYMGYRVKTVIVAFSNVISDMFKQSMGIKCSSCLRGRSQNIVSLGTVTKCQRIAGAEVGSIGS